MSKERKPSNERKPINVSVSSSKSELFSEILQRVVNSSSFLLFLEKEMGEASECLMGMTCRRQRPTWRS